VERSCGALLDEACPKARVEQIQIRRESKSHFFMRESSVMDYDFGGGGTGT
jgi:hypothetical protein